MYLKEHLDESFGDGPAHKPVEERLSAGRRALHRRRAATGVAAAAVAVMIGGTAWMTTTGTDAQSHDSDADAAATTSPSASPDKTPETKAPKSFGGEPATMRDGTVLLAAGWREVERVKNPMDYRRPLQSVGLSVIKGDQHKFVLIAQHGDGTSSMSAAAVGKLSSWLPAQVASQHQLDVENGVVPAGDEDQPPVSVTDDGALAPSPGVRILDQIKDPDLGPRFSRPGDFTAAAKLRSADGTITYVVVRKRARAATAEVIPTSGDFGSLARFLDHARGEYDSGSGLR